GIEIPLGANGALLALIVARWETRRWRLARLLILLARLPGSIGRRGFRNPRSARRFLLPRKARPPEPVAGPRATSPTRRRARPAVRAPPGRLNHRCGCRPSPSAPARGRGAAW